MVGLPGTLGRLDANLRAHSTSRDRAKVCLGTLSTVQLLLQHFPGRRDDAGQRDDDDDDDDLGCPATSSNASWTKQDVMPFVVASMDDALGPRVRASAVSIAVQMHQTFGIEAMTPLLDKLRPAIRTLLRQKFQEAEEDGADEPFDDEDGDEGVEMPNLMICGTAMAQK